MREGEITLYEYGPTRSARCRWVLQELGVPFDTVEVDLGKGQHGSSEYLARAATFYDAAFGWPRRIDVPVLVEYALPDGRGLGVYQREGFAKNTGEPAAAPPRDGTTATELYLRCDDLDAAIARVEAAGARLLSARAPRDWGDEAAYYADPDGNVLALAG